MQLKSLILALALVASTLASSHQHKGIAPIRQPHVSSHGSPKGAHQSSCESVPSTGKITYHSGGRVLTQNVSTYGIFYGKWTSKQVFLLTNVLKHIGNSPYYAIEKGYGVKGTVLYKRTVNISTYDYGTTFSDATLPKIVSDSITKHGLPIDTNGVYFIFTDKNVRETSGFCTQYCGFHTSAVIKGKRLLYAFIGNPARCIGSCGPCNLVTSPNNDPGVDAMASILSHELVETTSDPYGNAWYDASGYENADKCAYTYGSVYTAGAGVANMKLGTKNYLIQQNWDNIKGRCALHP